MHRNKRTYYSLTDKHDLKEVYNRPYEDTDEERLRSTRDKHIARMRLKTVISGDILESETYPVWDTRSACRRAPKKKEQRAAQRNLNNKNAVKALVRLINTNFTPADVWLTVTYDDDHLPENPKAADARVYNYLRRVKRMAKKLGYDELKYVVVVHYDDDPKKKKRVHHHIVINFPDRNILEEMWDGHGRTQARRLQPDECGFEGLARYIARDPHGKRRYTASRNLEKPTVIVSDYRMTRGKAEKILRGRNPAKETYEKIYDGYIFTDIKAFTSDYVTGSYLYVRMRRRT